MRPEACLAINVPSGPNERSQPESFRGWKVGRKRPSRRDAMIVARQFIAWYPVQKANRPVGYGMIGSDKRATIRTIIDGVRITTVPYGTASLLTRSRQ